VLTGTPKNDVARFATVFLVFVSLVASYIPSRRAIRIQPTDALRAD